MYIKKRYDNPRTGTRRVQLHLTVDTRVYELMEEEASKIGKKLGKFVEDLFLESMGLRIVRTDAIVEAKDFDKVRKFFKNKQEVEDDEED